ncbi:MAG TPA: PLDc_N domain-containing protein [Dehalococcoidia bacterium]|nr:PLDc_N domain-containing protein [Dehalococcoidia bacterium]
MNDWEALKDALPFLIPLAVIELGLMVFALVDLARRQVVKGGQKWPWVLVIVLLGIIGPIFYLLVGREQY